MKMETGEHREQRLRIEREFGVGIRVHGNEGEDEMREMATTLAAKRKKTAGWRALKVKYGAETAKQIISRGR